MTATLARRQNAAIRKKTSLRPEPMTEPSIGWTVIRLPMLTPARFSGESTRDRKESFIPENDVLLKALDLLLRA